MNVTMKDAHEAIKNSGARLISKNGLAGMLNVSSEMAAQLLHNLYINGYLDKVNQFDYTPSKYFNDDSRLK